MSRVGKMLIPITSGASVEIEGQLVRVKGPKGELSQQLESEIQVVVEDGQARVFVAQPSKRSAALWGLYRTLIANMVEGVTKGFTKDLEMAGVGHRAAMQGSKLQLSVGFSHPVIIDPPAGISFSVADGTKISVAGFDKEKVGQIAAEIRGVKPPEPYKGKGIHYVGEHIRRKAGKAAKVGSK